MNIYKYIPTTYIGDMNYIAEICILYIKQLLDKFYVCVYLEVANSRHKLLSKPNKLLKTTTN